MTELGIAFATVMVLAAIFFPIFIITIIGMWKVFRKAGYEGWECIVPIYNGLIFLKIIGKPWWWIFLYCIPYVNTVFMIWGYNMLSKSFGKDEGFTAGLFFLGFIFIPILGMGSAQYQGPYGDQILFRQYRQGSDTQFDFERNELV